MNEISSLIARAQKYLKSAQLLLKSGDYESAASRIYYAMFYSVEAVLLEKSLSFSSHKAVISAFGKHFITTNIFPKDMGRELHRAFEKRQISDYEYTFVITKKEAKEMLEIGKRFVESIAHFLEQNKIRSYRHDN